MYIDGSLEGQANKCFYDKLVFHIMMGGASRANKRFYDK
jgi:hypothetical protein